MRNYVYQKWAFIEPVDTGWRNTTQVNKVKGDIIGVIEYYILHFTGCIYEVSVHSRPNGASATAALVNDANLPLRTVPGQIIVRAALQDVSGIHFFIAPQVVPCQASNSFNQATLTAHNSINLPRWVFMCTFIWGSALSAIGLLQWVYTIIIVLIRKYGGKHEHATSSYPDSERVKFKLSMLCVRSLVFFLLLLD